MQIGREDALRREEAEQRAQIVGEVEYDIHLELRAGATGYGGTMTARFAAEPGRDTFIEFRGKALDSVALNGSTLESEWDGSRIVLPAHRLEARNELRIAYRNDYDRTGEGFHHFVDPEDGSEYLYTGFEPYQAHRLWPCFDQPDLKATYGLTVDAPAEWEVISAGPVVGTTTLADGRLQRRYETSLRFSPYLFVVAGPYRSVHDDYEGIPLAIYCRASLFEYLDHEELFEITKQGMRYYTELFGRPYPFTKYDQIFVPEFNWGGMENVGAVTYTEGMIFRDPPTVPMRLRRVLKIFLHELAHMWFGNLVTMRWWNDLWLNESFATFVAYLAIDRATDFENGWQDFNTRVKSVAYHDDQLPTTHPIADDIDSTDETFLNFDQITYGKGASVLRQLVATIGYEAFERGLRTYFERHAFGNTTLPEFLAALQQGSGRDLIGWAARWLQTTSVNTLSVDWSANEGRVESLRLRQAAPPDHPTLRPHSVAVGLVVDEGDALRTVSLPAEIDTADARVPGAIGLPEPALVFPNHEDLTYTKVGLDARSLEFATEQLHRVDDPLLRQLLWSALWEMVRDRNLSSLEFLDLVERHLGRETSAQILQVNSMRAVRAMASYVPEEQREAAAARLVRVGRVALDGVPPGDAQVIWFRAMIGAAGSPDDLAQVGRILDGHEPVVGLSIDQEMRWDVAVKWIAHGMPGAEARLAAEVARDPSDRGQRSRLRAESSRPDPDIKASTWARLLERDFGSLHLDASAMAGFRWYVQRDLLERYAAEFFDRVAGVFAEWEWEAAKAYFLGLYPGYRVDTTTLERSELLLEDTGDVRLRRLLAESIDGLERALACRDYAKLQAPAAPEPPPAAAEPPPAAADS